MDLSLFWFVLTWSSVTSVVFYFFKAMMCIHHHHIKPPGMPLGVYKKLSSTGPRTAWSELDSVPEWVFTDKAYALWFLALKERGDATRKEFMALSKKCISDLEETQKTIKKLKKGQEVMGNKR
jgi:hypothetical protein